MAYYIAQLEEQGEVSRIGEFCSPHLEIPEIAHRVMRTENGGQALVFESNGTPWPVAMNLYGSRVRMLSALRANSYEAVAERIRRLAGDVMSPAEGVPSRIEKLKRLGKLLRYTPRRLRGIKPPCQEVINRTPDLRTLPVTQSWPHDGGAFFTLPMVITRDPESGTRNVGMYRMQVLDGQSTGMHWHVHKTGASHFRAYAARGERMPIAVAFGGDPLLAYCATAPLPEGIDEWLLAGFLRERRVLTTRGVTVDLEVPAEADFIIEGYIDPNEELVLEGPFGDHTGFYSLADMYPRLQVTCITSRHDAIFPATVVGVPPMEDTYIAEATEQIFLPLLQLTMSPEVHDMFLPPAGVAHNLVLASVRKNYAGQGERVANLFWGAGQMMFSKYIVALDESVNLRNSDEVLRALASHVTDKKQLLFGRGPLDVLDHSSVEAGIGGKLFINAMSHSRSTPIPKEVEPKWDVWLQAEAKLTGRTLWLGGIPLFAVVVGWHSAEFDEQLLHKITQAIDQQPRCIALVDAEAPWEDDALLLWLMLAQSAPERDVIIQDDSNGFTLFIDCRIKASGSATRPWPNVAVSDSATQTLVDRKWEELKLGKFVPSPSLQLEQYHLGNSAIVDGHNQSENN